MLKSMFVCMCIVHKVYNTVSLLFIYNFNFPSFYKRKSLGAFYFLSNHKYVLKNKVF